MTRMLDVLERFLNYLGYIYIRLDGTTKVEQRQVCKYLLTVGLCVPYSDICILLDMNKKLLFCELLNSFLVLLCGS